MPDAPTTDQPTGGYATLQRRTLRTLVVGQVIGTVGVGVAPSIGILAASEVTANEAWAGLARTASTLGAALFGIPLGALAARFGRRVALAAGWWVAATGAAVLVPAAQFRLVPALFAGLLLIGAGSAVALQSRFAATDLATPQRRGRSLALVVWVGTLGSVLGPNLGVPAAAMKDLGINVYAGAFLIAACCLALAGVVVFIWLRPDPLLVRQAAGRARPEARVTARQRLALIRDELRVNRRARYAVIAIITAQIVMVAVMTMTPVHIAHTGGDITIVGITISLHVVGMYALSPVVGQLADRVGHRATIGIGIGLFVASLLVGALRPHNLTWVVVSLLLLGLGWSFCNVAASALFAAVVAEETRATAQGGVDALANIGAAVAAFAAGPLLAASDFATLSLVAMVVLVPLAWLTVAGARSGPS
ncbi:MFS transporter [Parenemella sanctibonifatiensis]|uniref:MFS transporter n=1 Tax=Parenemella sanctibonifatiensis TaxID=2016505 RepID=UPI001E427E3B|nr:MFS transporter [Parenemella sanctibonifatiensis]